MSRETENFQTYVVALHNHEGAIFGGGFLLQHDLVVTCSHVVRDIVGVYDSRDLFVGEHFVYVSRPFHSKLAKFKLKAVLKVNRPDKTTGIPKDLSILRIVPPPNWRFKPPALIIDADLRDHDALAIGFPADSDSSTESDYTLGGPRAHDQWIYTVGKSELGQEIREGYSGCPVWDRNLKGIVGILTEADEDRKVACIIPMHHIAMLEDSIQDEHDFAVERDAKKLAPPGLIRRLLDRLLPRFHHFLTQTGIFSFPEEYDYLEKYTEDTYATVGESLEERILIPLKAKSFGSDMRPRQPRRSFYSPVQQFVREIEGHHELKGESSTTILALSKKSKVVKSLVSRILRSKDPLILLGEPGSGKSLTLDQARFTIANKNRKRVFPDIAIYAPLGEFHTTNSNVTAKDVSNFVNHCADKRIRPYLKDLRKYGRLIVFLDGMDEMSRQGYNERVEAISIYARASKGKARTIVACRTADFSPRFKHRRLVILPFSTQQIRTYLKLQFPGRNIEINGEQYTHKDLAKRLSQFDLSIDARVPYVLWMFSLFIRDRGNWPSSRVELLTHCYEQKLRDYFEQRNIVEQNAQLEKTFTGWGRIAFEIAQANKGMAIPLESLRNIDGIDKAISLGRGCGALEQSLDLEKELIKFEHHRAEEFFTACYMHKDLITVDWEELLDYPRWRETLGNLLLLGGGKEGIHAVELSLEQAAGWNDNESTEQRKLVERVKFAGRMHADFHQPKQFHRKLANAVYNLARKGNPITRIKMFEVARRTPGIDVQRTAGPSLRSEIDYLRTQALMVASASDQAGSREYLPNQLFLAFANSTLVKRTKEFLSIGKQIKKWQPISLILVVFAAFFIQPFFQLIALNYLTDWSAEYTRSLSAKVNEETGDGLGQYPKKLYADYAKKIEDYRSKFFLNISDKEAFTKRLKKAAEAKAEKEKSDKSEREALEKIRNKEAWLLTSNLFSNKIFKFCLFATGILCWIFVAIRFPSLTIFALLCSGLIVLALSTSIIFVVNDLDGKAFWFLLFPTSVCYLVGYPLIYPILFLISAGGMLIGCAYAGVIKQNLDPKRYLIAMWEDQKVRFALSNIKFLLIYLLYFLAFIFLVPLSMFITDVILAFSPQWISENLLKIPMLSSFVTLIPVLFLVAISYVSFLYLRSKEVDYTLILILILCMIAWPIVVVLIIWLVNIAAVGTAFSWLFRFALFAIIIVLLGGLLYLIAKNTLLLLFIRRVPFTERGSLSDRLARYNPQRQSVLLNSVSAKGLGVRPDVFLNILIDVETLIKEEPALSTYWRKRFEVEELVEQGRE